MKIKTLDGRILESNNELVIEQWKKLGYTEHKEKKTATKTKEAGADTEKEAVEKEITENE